MFGPVLPTPNPSSASAQPRICGWRNAKGPNEVFTLETEVVALDGGHGSRSRAFYGDPVGQQYRELWVVEFRRRAVHVVRGGQC